MTHAEGNVTTYTDDLLTGQNSPVSGVITHDYNEHDELLAETDSGHHRGERGGRSGSGRPRGLSNV